MEKKRNFKAKLKDFANGTSSAVLLILFVVAIIQFYCIAAPENTANEWSLGIYRLAKSSVNYAKYIFSDNMTEGLIMSVCGAILAGIQGTFVLRKSKCTAILSQGIKRESIFNNRIIPPIFGLFLTVIIPKLFAYHANIEADGFSLELLRFCTADLLALITAGIFVYTVVIACCFITKHWLDALTTSASILFFGSITKSLIADLLHSTLYGGGRVGIMLVDSTNLLDPMQVTAALLTQEVSYEFAKENTVYFLIAGSVLMLVICIAVLHFIKKHFCTDFKTENIGRISDNRAAMMFNKITVGLLGASIVISSIYQYFDPFFNNTAILIMAAAGIIGGCLMSMLYNLLTAERFHLTKRDLVSFASLCGVTLLCLIFGLTNFFGLYDKIPQAEDVEKVTVSVPFDGFVPTPDISTGFTTADVFNTIELELTEKESIKLATSIHTAVVSDKAPQFAGNIHLTYQLKNGTKLERQYAHISETAYDSVMALWDTVEVKEFYRKTLFPTEEMLENDNKWAVLQVYTTDLSQIVIVSKSQVREPLLDLTTENNRLIRKAIYKDICALSYRDYFTPDSPQLGVITIDFKDVSYSLNKPFIFYVTEKCTNTIAVLKELKLYEKLDLRYTVKSVYCIDTEEYMKMQLPLANAVYLNILNKEAIDNIHVPYYSMEHNNFGFNSPYVEQYNVNDPSQWKDLIDSAYMAYYIKNDGKILVVDFEDYPRMFYVIP